MWVSVIVSFHFLFPLSITLPGVGRLIIADFNQQNGREKEEELKRTFPDVQSEFILCNVSDEKDVMKVMERAAASPQFPLRAVVHCAGTCGGVGVDGCVDMCVIECIRVCHSLLMGICLTMNV